MDLKRLALAGLALWVGIFVEVSVLMFGFNLTGESYYISHYILLAIICAIVAHFYFKNQKASALEGLKAGFAMVVVGIVLDAIITVPFFVKDYSFFTTLPLLLGYLESIAMVAAVGWVKTHQSNSKRAIALGA
ncbi:MAG TPA: DUF5367 family protein [archaeon]|nr:DUF5367 family protein [archaeon]